MPQGARASQANLPDASGGSLGDFVSEPLALAAASAFKSGLKVLVGDKAAGAI